MNYDEKCVCGHRVGLHSVSMRFCSGPPVTGETCDCARYEPATNRSTPRIAHSLDDLAVGMTVAWKWREESWSVHTISEAGATYAWTTDGGGITKDSIEEDGCVVILADPDPEPDPAEQAWEAYNAEVGHDADENPLRYTLVYRAFLAGCRAGQEGDHAH